MFKFYLLYWQDFVSTISGVNDIETYVLKIKLKTPLTGK